MLGKLPLDQQQSVFASDLRLMLNPNHELVHLAKNLPWDELESSFAAHYAKDGRKSIPIRVMVSLVMLRTIFGRSDENVIKEWLQNPYWQFLSGMIAFQWTPPCNHREVSKFRKRIGPDGCKRILACCPGKGP